MPLPKTTKSSCNTTFAWSLTLIAKSRAGVYRRALANAERKLLTTTSLKDIIPGGWNK